MYNKDNSKHSQKNVGGSLDIWHEKYLKYKSKYLNLRNHLGGSVLEDLKSKEKDLCKIIAKSDIELFIKNSGLNNLGIGFLHKENLFFKFAEVCTLKDQYEYGKLLASLKHVYPYFIDTYSYFHCNTGNLGEIGNQISPGFNRDIDILVTQKGDISIYKWVNDHVYKFIIKNIPNFESLIQTLDNSYISLLKKKGFEHKYDTFYNYRSSDIDIIDFFNNANDDEKYDEIKREIITEYYELNKSIIIKLQQVNEKFKNEFLPLLRKNLKLICYQQLIINMISLLYINTILLDNNVDNYLIRIQKWDGTSSNFFEVKIKSETFNIVNVADWGDEKEIIYMYPIDYPAIYDFVLEKLDKDNLLPNPDLNKQTYEIKEILDYDYDGNLIFKRIGTMSVKEQLHEIIPKLLKY